MLGEKGRCLEYTVLWLSPWGARAALPASAPTQLMPGGTLSSFRHTLWTEQALLDFQAL